MATAHAVNITVFSSRSVQPVHYNVIQRGCKAISGKKIRNCPELPPGNFNFSCWLWFSEAELSSELETIFRRLFEELSVSFNFNLT